ncbi:bifunctional methylenetetrahydrofolate dehydrogenase/methenyltetrahydrofolate cyclohydrolase FolD [Suttonella sp. R2A3]|uniref:bifunctional methylenetetrahydrofolate dehydrogenase/methenyltetrahydrofolate cyclohydrolase FolD n=1 Tax=Suttonella sp. R2A3 TaxID=2908648 RepID=UPI001F4565BB|nr:bifunctional methylenetetrahydrofolate dehydrogenase/methenyltetrahydrofolate cyclohydrolase FolD [Suttonella sp. R2A3]UJF24574.1 bifunctional methylenetetrahydrofolate dehydrogenase/methenyltetrahydrofolate cyclohydrolase FolD [Suttonella sp. R2A3]
MSAEVIDGKAFAEKIREQVGENTAEFIAQGGVQPGLAVVLVGNDPASEVYVANKNKQAEAVGFYSVAHYLPEDTTQDALMAQVEALNADPRIHGILVQLPLPSHLDSDAVLNAIDPDKDVDGFHPVNIGRLWSGQSAPVPCTPLGCSLLLKERLGDLAGKKAIIIGRSNIVGKPMAALLLAANATVTIAHSKTPDLPGLCREADIVVAAVGRAEMVQGDWIKPGAIVLDVGINRIERDGKKKLVGDVDFASASAIAGAITPVPGGIGPMTIACLLRNTLTCAKTIDNRLNT